MKPKHKTSDSELMKAFGFTEEDLVANREGYMTISQQQKLVKQRKQNLITNGLGFAIMGVILLGLFPQAMWQYAGSFASLIVVLLLLIGCSLSVLGWKFWKKSEAELYEGTVYTLDAFIKKRWAFTKNGMSYWISVPGKEFYLNRKMWRLIREDILYRLYYVPYTITLIPTILTIEPVKLKSENY